MTALKNVAFDNVFEDVTRHFLKLDTNHYCAKGKTPIVDQGEGYIAGYTDNENAEDYVLDSAVVFGDHTRRFKFIDFPFCIGADGAKVLRPKINASTRYLFHYLNSLQIESNGYSRHFKFLKRKTFNIPPLAQQQRIAAILDKAAEIKAKREQTIAKLDALTSSTFTELFLKDGKWPALKLIEVCTTTSGGTPKRDVAAYYGGEIFWVKSGELAADLVLNTEETLTLDGVKNSSAKVMPPKTVLLAMYGATIGAVSMLGVSAATNQAICCITAGEKLLPEFLVYYLKSIKHNLIKLAVGGAQPNINQDIVRNLVVPIPPVSLQTIFIERATAIRQQIVKAEMSLAQIKATIASLQHQAFTTGFNA